MCHTEAVGALALLDRVNFLVVDRCKSIRSKSLSCHPEAMGPVPAPPPAARFFFGEKREKARFCFGSATASW